MLFPLLGKIFSNFIPPPDPRGGEHTMSFQNIMNVAKNQPKVLTTDEEVEQAIKELKKKKCKEAEGWVN